MRKGAQLPADSSQLLGVSPSSGGTSRQRAQTPHAVMAAQKEEVTWGRGMVRAFCHMGNSNDTL